MQQPPPPPQTQYYPPPDYYPPQPPQGHYVYPTNNTGYAEMGQALGEESKIRPSSGWKDIWAIGLWLCNFIAFIAVSVIGIRTFSQHSGPSGGNRSPVITFDADTVKMFGYSAIVGFGLSFLYLLLANAFPRPMIISTFVGSIIVYFAVTIYYFYRHYYTAAIIFLIFSCLYLACFWFWRSRIPFATVMLETVTSITRRYKSTLVVGFISLVVQTAFSIWFIITVIGAYETYYTPTGSNTRMNLVMVFLVFSFYWTSQVITYAVHVTLAGIFATVYFLAYQVAHPVWGSARRALTTSFGSICFGSLLIAIVNLIRFLVSVARQNTDNAIFAFFFCILECIISCIEGFFEWFSYYAFSGVAIYGQGFIPSAKRTWSLMQDRGLEALVNDNLIGNVLFMGGLLVGVLCSLLGFIYLEVARPAYNASGNMVPIVVLVCFLIGASMFSSIATVISSGVATTFVCLAEDPEALRRSQPALYEKIRETWPQVVQGI
ncbi:plasma-membrane choline transporter-domain-containing protein [Radiomyces spectabilis]|uniref:plasma-membrane choline transporter-domain-containing protein n=1 Tax=Radiomyces spectabilis TaxID=64574 RepID=UPI00222123F2|nr:plasma-membrane choline transporter-domain-containing protein [Radiomyces spectabilis]KAI8381023.1 plasma-membrane choline transporter-domain-containing protein [Radiomyces spectabilis]